MWRDEKTEYLRRNRDYTRLLDGDDAEVRATRVQNRGRSKDRHFVVEDDDGSPERQEYLNRRRRLKELERQKLTKLKNGLYASCSRGEVPKAGEQNKSQGCSRSGGDLPLSKEKKKLPYDRSFGSFFGPSEPVVAKRIIEEARAREEAEIVAAKEANASLEAEQKKTVASLSAGKVFRDCRPPRLPKPVDKATEKARKLKEARDYSFLFDDSPLPGHKVADREGPASSKLGVARHDAASVWASNDPPRKIPSELLKSTLGSTGSDGSATSSRPFQGQSKSSQLSRSLPRQGPHDRYPSGRSAVQNMSVGGRAAKLLTSKVSSAGPGRPDPRKGTDLRKASMVRELGAGSMASNENKSIPSLALDWRNSQILDRHPTQAIDRHPTQLSARPLTRQTDRLPFRVTERQPARATDRRHTQSTGGLPAQVKDTGSLMAKVSERGPVMTQGLKKAAPTSATYRTGAGLKEPRRQVLASQKLKQKPSSKVASRAVLSGYTRARYSEDSWRDETWHKRARGLSEELDERPRRRNKLPDVGVNLICHKGRAGSSSEGDDSLIDDDDDPGNVSSMIHSIMGYNPNKYCGNDDLDDRSMEVGFRAIQAEERRSAREARLEDERELAMIEAEDRAERLRKAKKKRNRIDR